MRFSIILSAFAFIIAGSCPDLVSSMLHGYPEYTAYRHWRMLDEVVVNVTAADGSSKSILHLRPESDSLAIRNIWPNNMPERTQLENGKEPLTLSAVLYAVWTEALQRRAPQLACVTVSSRALTKDVWTRDNIQRIMLLLGLGRNSRVVTMYAPRNRRLQPRYARPRAQLEVARALLLQGIYGRMMTELAARMERGMADIVMRRDYQTRLHTWTLHYWLARTQHDAATTTTTTTQPPRVEAGRRHAGGPSRDQ